MFHRSRSNLALWFTLTMGSILVVFAGVLYYQAVLDELKDLDRLLHKKSKLMTVNAKYDPRKKQLDLENVPLLGSNVPPQGTEFVYARWYDTKGQLLQFFGKTPEAEVTIISGFHTLKTTFYSSEGASTVTWLRELTLPVYQDNLLIGYLQVATPLTSTQNNLAQLRLVLLLTVPVTLGVIGLAGWYLGGIAMQPIRDSYDQLQRFTADASHELRSPLSAIISNAQYGLLSKSHDMEAQRQRFGKIFDVAKSMNTLVNNLLLLARHAGRLSSESLQKVDLKSELVQIADEYTTQEAAKHLNLTYTLPTGSVIVLGDVGLLRQAVVNLLDNACKYSPAGGQVQLRLFTQSHWAVIEVIDNGIGIPEADLPHIFERFYRVDKKRSRKTGGCGLGLSIVQQIVSAHGGHISVKSVVEKGSTFQIILPLIANFMSL
ncbi:two-component sensor histidine kinase [Fischerella thermalis CCMEE 5198]|uniref:sensor histidine kinase n=1 Tax=Fischerella thermalis TaxID=372787 RepID=UPI000C807526|nr:HAMP domain-containing sensor histidine kinase [Fischerella thermalis]PLZ93660.1 two-component sensor histidine kinase [Fischerella thermalis CCMEE 5196]PMB23482.1 two-component sensor histidine kinase [Fischerella thermalis CCMEE 5198]